MTTIITQDARKDSFAQTELKTQVISRNSTSKGMTMGEHLKGLAPVLKRPVATLHVVFDTSKSMPEDLLRGFASIGFHAIIDALKTAESNSRHNISLAVHTFSADFKTVLSPTPIAELGDDFALDPLVPNGVTDFEHAVEKIHEYVDEYKREMDEVETPRAGTVVLWVTDARATDKTGHETPLSDKNKIEIALRNETRKVSTVAIGLGKYVDTEALKALAPGVVVAEDSKGEEIRTKKAIVLENFGEGLGTEDFNALFKLLAMASSSSMSENAFQAEGTSFANNDDEVVPGVETVVLSERFKVVD